MQKLLAIVPAYNESESIVHVLAELREHASDFDVLVVDDGSADDTAARARAAGARVVQLPFNLGIGAAVQTGYRFAADHGYDLAVQVDADGQHDARQLAALAAFLDEHPDVDMVVGTRFLKPGAEGYRSSAARRVGIGFFARMLSAILDRPVSDPTSGLRMTGRRSIELFAREYPNDYPEVEAILLAHAHRLKSAEVPVVMRPRMSGASSITPTRSVYYMFKVLVAVLIGLLRREPALAAPAQSIS